MTYNLWVNRMYAQAITARVARAGRLTVPRWSPSSCTTVRRLCVTTDVAVTIVAGAGRAATARTGVAASASSAATTASHVSAWGTEVRTHWRAGGGGVFQVIRDDVQDTSGL